MTSRWVVEDRCSNTGDHDVRPAAHVLAVVAVGTTSHPSPFRIMVDELRVTLDGAVDVSDGAELAKAFADVTAIGILQQREVQPPNGAPNSSRVPSTAASSSNRPKPCWPSGSESAPNRLRADAPTLSHQPGEVAQHLPSRHDGRISTRSQAGSEGDLYMGGYARACLSDTRIAGASSATLSEPCVRSAAARRFRYLDPVARR